MKFGPEGIFRHSGFKVFLHGTHPFLTYIHRNLHQFQFIIGFDGPCGFGDLFTFDQFKTSVA